jgi:hypothetical protein
MQLVPRWVYVGSPGSSITAPRFHTVRRALGRVDTMSASVRKCGHLETYLEAGQVDFQRWLRTNKECVFFRISLNSKFASELHIPWTVCLDGRAPEPATARQSSYSFKIHASVSFCFFQRRNGLLLCIRNYVIDHRAVSKLRFIAGFMNMAECTRRESREHGRLSSPSSHGIPRGHGKLGVLFVHRRGIAVLT